MVAYQPASARVVSKGQMNEADDLAYSAREPQSLARRTRRRQGLPETVTDPRVIARIVLLLTSGGRHVGDATDGPGSAEETGITRAEQAKLNTKPVSDTPQRSLKPLLGLHPSNERREADLRQMPQELGGPDDVDSAGVKTSNLLRLGNRDSFDHGFKQSSTPGYIPFLPSLLDRHGS
jgi:hypothetical protein